MLSFRKIYFETKFCHKSFVENVSFKSNYVIFEICYSRILNKKVPAAKTLPEGEKDSILQD